MLSVAVDAGAVTRPRKPVPVVEPELRARKSLPVYQIPDDWIPVEGVPATRADCPPRPCPHINCRHHLWRLEGRDRAGRPHDGKRPPTIIRAFGPTTCALDVADRESSAEEVGLKLGGSSRRMQQIQKQAVEKLKAAGVRIGIKIEE